MRKTKGGLFLITMAVLAVLFSCKNEFFPTPFVPGDDNRSSSAEAPDGLSASQGEYRSISLSWNQKPNAERYYIYRANSPLDDFVRCGETTAGQFKLAVTPGSTVYYKVSAVSKDGKESAQSIFVRGTSLAQPVITDIIEITESGVTVTWYMDNAKEDTYKNNLLYTVYCFEGSVSTPVAQLALDGAVLAENKAPFANLKPNAQYGYQVEAYLRGDQHASEKSDKVDAATARRMRPAAPVNLRASRGTSHDKIELSFELPDMVDIALGENQYDPKPVYFVIHKRPYSESGNNAYNPVCVYFGSNAVTAITKGGKSFSSYIPGATIKWIDNIGSNYRGVEYEYQVQSYVDDTPKVISSDSSKASATGWALNEGNLSFGEIGYTLNEYGSLYASAQLPLDFDFDPKGVTYDYSLVETIEPIDVNEPDPNPNDPNGTVTRTSNTLTYDEIKNYVAQMDLTQKTNEDTPGRGIYSYKVKINLNNDTIDTVSTIGKVEVSEDKDPIIVEGFSVQDGYTDKFVLKWHFHKNRRYVLSVSNDRTDWTEIGTVNPNPDDASTDRTENYTHTYTANVTPGLTKYFAIRPYRDIGGGNFKQGQMVYAPAASRTLGVPELSLSGDGPSYSEITVAWTEAQKADTYRIKYWYTGEGNYNTAITEATVHKNNLKVDAFGKLEYSFMPFENNTIDAAKAGLEIQVAVDALNEGLRTNVGGNEIATTSTGNAHTRLVGPALLNPGANHAVSPTDIDVSWNEVSGANGYYVFRRQFNMNNTAEEGIEAIVYYVPASAISVIDVTGKELALVSNEKTDTTTVKATASFANSRYTLKDMYMNDSEYGGGYVNHTAAYRNQQNDMAQGFSYRYYVVPVVNRGGSPEPLTSIEFTYAKDGSNKNTGISYYTIQENGKNIRYNGAAALEKDGFTIGFGQNVTATKGTYASSGNVNNGIQITWSAPPRLAGVAGFSPRYNVYRRVTGGATWDTVNTNINAMQTVDIPPTRGVIYEYAVGITNGGAGIGSEPGASRRFIERCATYRDERSRSHYLGYMLGYIKMTSVTRGEDSTLNASLGERVTWQSAGMGIQNNVSTDYNWGIDGYTVYVMNRNISNGWHIIADNITNFQNQINQSIVLTPSNTPTVTVTDRLGTITRNLLFVLRDYKHFYRVRTYVMNGDTKIYGPDDPGWTYQYRFGTNQADHINASNAMENDYVKWGARQITKNEFITIAALYFARGQERVHGSGAWPSSSKSASASTNMGGSGSVSIGYSFLVGPSGGMREHNFSNYKDDLMVRTDDWMTFVTLNGRANAYNFPLGQRPRSYWENGWITVTGPWDTPNLYSGQIKFGTGGRDDGSNVKWGGGNVVVKYPTAEAEQSFSVTGQNHTPFEFPDQSSNNRLNTNSWR